MLSWIHPHLSQSVDSGKGRQLQASQRIQKGEVLLIDPPYAIIPISSVDHNSLLCSNPECNTSVPLDTGSRCSNRCNADVIWCSDSCRSADKPRHVFECTWLAKYTNSLQSKWGEYNFGMLWLMSTFKSGWPAIDALCGTPETWSHSQVREWTVLVKKYLSSSALPHSMSNDAVLALICKEEANSFGLYPRETGVCPPPDPPVPRGEQFGAAVYPRASIANHSCCPNISHKPDKSARMIFTANRDISAGDECCITYFDMTQYVALKDRREHLQGLFRFKCRCARCIADEEEEQEQERETGKALYSDEGDGDVWDAFPGFD